MNKKNQEDFHKTVVVTNRGHHIFQNMVTHLTQICIMCLLSGAKPSLLPHPYPTKHHKPPDNIPPKHSARNATHGKLKTISQKYIFRPQLWDGPLYHSLSIKL